ncbi:putative ABC1 protein At2g40090 [Eucalyptus grandis]|uniref:putative ABC1 protein At2g40090 n=1 Tax=Eucalyptus grandis TaxID=71139 RepID=UPI00192F030A|nr:putative ABC1 protein At2g40090 [Eucalyptus grandis]
MGRYYFVSIFIMASLLCSIRVTAGDFCRHPPRCGCHPPKCVPPNPALNTSEVKPPLSPRSTTAAEEPANKKPQLVLLDHGLYKELDVSTRTNYAALWKENSVKLGAGEDLCALFAGILTMRPRNRVVDPAIDHLVIQGSDSERSDLQMYASQYFSEISELLRRLLRVILLMLKTNDCLRSVNIALGSSLETFLIIGKISSKAVLEAKKYETRSLVRRLSVWLEEISVEARLLAMQLALWLLHLRKALPW